MLCHPCICQIIGLIPHLSQARLFWSGSLGFGKQSPFLRRMYSYNPYSAQGKLSCWSYRGLKGPLLISLQRAAVVPNELHATLRDYLRLFIFPWKRRDSKIDRYLSSCWANSHAFTGAAGLRPYRSLRLTNLFYTQMLCYKLDHGPYHTIQTSTEAQGNNQRDIVLTWCYRRPVRCTMVTYTCFWTSDWW